MNKGNPTWDICVKGRRIDDGLEPEGRNLNMKANFAYL